MGSTHKPPVTTEAPVPDPLASTPYRSIRPIGAGSMGDVLEAEHRELRKRVVVKLFSLKVSDPASVPAMEDRFRLEAQALASLDGHPNIVQVSDCGRTPGGQLYLVMQKLEGRTLQDELDVRGPFAPERAVHLVGQMLAGLEVVHAAGLVHRDIKPSNLFLCHPTRSGGERVLKILDFGIVKLLAAEASARAPRPLAVPTAEGTVLGSPRYVAPEQALGQRVDGRADLYSAGAVLYAILTGKDPFHDETGVYEIMLAHIERTPAPPSALAPSKIPSALDAAVLRALAKRPEDRFASAKEFHGALLHALVAPAPRWPTTERLETSAFRDVPLGASPTWRAQRDSDAELTLRRAPPDTAKPAASVGLDVAIAANEQASRVWAERARARRRRLRIAAVVGVAILLAIVGAGLLRVLLAVHPAGGVR